MQFLHPPDRVAIRAVRRLEVEVDPLAVLVQVHRHLIAGVTLRVIANDVDLAITPQPASKLIEVLQEYRRVPPLLRRPHHQEDLPGPPVDRPAQVSFLVVAGGLDLRLAALDHPHRADLRAGVDIDVMLEDGRLVVGQFGQDPAQGGELGRPSHPSAPAADSLAADFDLVLSEHPPRDGFTAPPAAENPEVPRGALGDALDDNGDPGGGESKGPARLVPGPPPNPFLIERPDPAVDGPGDAGEEGGDSGPGVAVIQEGCGAIQLSPTIPLVSSENKYRHNSICLFFASSRVEYRLIFSWLGPPKNLLSHEMMSNLWNPIILSMSTVYDG